MTVIQTTNGKLIQVDDCDSSTVTQYRWYAYKHHGIWYAHTTNRPNGRTQLKIHRLILGAKKGEVVDHIDGDGLNNCRYNLRITDHAGNQQNQHKTRNRSGFMNIAKTPFGTYQVIVKRGGIDVSCGTYKTVDKAIMVRRAVLNVFSFYGSDCIVLAVKRKRACDEGGCAQI